MTKIYMNLALGIVFVGGLIATESISAKNYVLMIHGRGPKVGCGVKTSKSLGRFASTVTPSGWTKRYVYWDSTQSPNSTGSCRGQTVIYSAIKTYCGGSNSCVIQCHSAGCMAMDRYFRNGSPRRNIRWVVFAGSASGGSEMADLKLWNNKYPIDSALKTGSARSWNHNASPVSLYHFAGYKGNLMSWRLPGEDDGAVAFHSGCGYAAKRSETTCSSGRSKWTRHYYRAYSSLGASSSKKAYNKNHGDLVALAAKGLKKLLGQ